MNHDDILQALSRVVARRGGPRWQSPVVVPYVDQIEQDKPEPDDGSNSWGREDNITLGVDPARHTMAELRLNKSIQVVATFHVVSPISPNPTTDVNGSPLSLFPCAVIDYGNGSAAVTQRTLRIDDQIDVSVTASYIRVRAYIGDVNGNPIALPSIANQANPPSMRVEVFLSRGIRGLPYANVRRHINTVTATRAVLATLPAELMEIHGHLSTAGGGPFFLQVFDKNAVPQNGDLPVAEYILDPTLNVESGERYLNPFPFAVGMSYGVSSTSGVFTLAVGVTAVVSIEIHRL